MVDESKSMVGIYFILDTHSTKNTHQAFYMRNAFKQLNMSMRWYNVPISEYDHNILMYPIICTYHRSHGGNGN